VLAYLGLDICIREPKVMKHATVELEEGAALTVTLNPRFREEKGA